MKRILTILAATLLLTAAMAGTASASSYDSVAEELSAIGVFRGTAGGFELDRAPTRSEAAIMLVRLYGAEDEAKAAYEAGKTVQGVCPEGWHLPSMDEFNALREYLGADGANAVKDPSYWPTTAGITNSAKMNVAVSGFYWHEGLTFLTDPAFTARFWTSTPRLRGMQFAYGDSASADDPTKAVLLSIYDDASTLNMQSYSIVPSVENHMYPIRCVMDPM